MTKAMSFMLATALLLSLVGCASTSITDSWMDPGLTGPVDLGKVVVVFMSKDRAIRHSAEDALAASAGNQEVATSYTVFGNGKPKDADEAAEELRHLGFGGAIVMRIISEDKELSYSPGMSYPGYYGSFGSYYGHGWGMAYSPGYMTTNTIVKVETSVFSLEDDKLLWSGVSKSFNPSGAAKMVESVAKAIAKDLTARGLI